MKSKEKEGRRKWREGGNGGKEGMEGRERGKGEKRKC